MQIQVDNAKAQQLAALLLKQSNVKWAGLGARDSLRLEAGMCLYGHDLDDTTTPVEAGLTWTIGKTCDACVSFALACCRLTRNTCLHTMNDVTGKRRRAEGGFLGADKVKAQLAAPVNVMRRRVGLIVEGAPARGTHVRVETMLRCVARLIFSWYITEGAEVFNASGKSIGIRGVLFHAMFHVFIIHTHTFRQAHQWRPIALSQEEHCHGLRRHWPSQSRYRCPGQGSRTYAAGCHRQDAVRADTIPQGLMKVYRSGGEWYLVWFVKNICDA